MRKAVAFGLFVITMLIGSGFVIIGTSTEADVYVWIGMIMIALGVLNLAISATIPVMEPHVRLEVVEPKKPVKRKTARKRATKSKKKRK